MRFNLYSLRKIKSFYNTIQDDYPNNSQEFMEK